MTKEQSMEIVNLVEKNQPQALINSRIGNGVGDYSTYGDHEIPARNIPGLWEAVNTSNDSWGYSWCDENWKGPTEIIKDLVSVVARGGNFMLNVGPKADGTIPEINAAFLRQSGEWLRNHAEAIYGAQPSPWLNALPWGDVTVSNNKLNLFLFDWRAGESIWLPGVDTKIKSVRIQGTDEKLVFNQGQDKWVEIQIPKRKKKELVEVITVELEGTLKIDPALAVDPVFPTSIRADFAKTLECEHEKVSWMEKFGEWKHRVSIGKWTSMKSRASWVVDLKSPGKYYVNIDYNAWKESDGGEWDLVTEDGNRLRIYTTETTGARPRFRDVRVGIIEFKSKGKQTLTFQPSATPVGGGMQLSSIILTPVE
jgi:alpha-L-fucosidase